MTAASPAAASAQVLNVSLCSTPGFAAPNGVGLELAFLVSR